MQDLSARSMVIDLQNIDYKKKKKKKKKGKIYISPQTTTFSPDGPPNYQCLDSGPQNYHFLTFWPHPSIYAVNFKQNSENISPTL
jgi:hypothetical protein